MNCPTFSYTPKQVSRIPVEIKRLTPGRSIPDKGPHQHTFYEIILISGGQGSHRLADQWFDVQSGMIFVIPPGTVHDCSGLEAVEGWRLLFTPEALDLSSPSGLSPERVAADSMVEVLRLPLFSSDRPIQLAPSSCGIASRLLKHIQSELSDRGFGYEHAVRSNLQLLLIHLARWSAFLTEASGLRVAQLKEQRFVDCVFKDIDRHFPNDSGLEAASARLGLSPGYLTTRVRKLTGKTYGYWVIERKMIEARRQLAQSDRPVAEISARLGYAEVESFVRRFQRYHSLSPANWRKVAFGNLENWRPRRQESDGSSAPEPA